MNGCTSLSTDWCTDDASVGVADVGDVQKVQCNLGMELGFKAALALRQHACYPSSYLHVCGDGTL